MYEQVMRAVNKLFGDTSVPVEETKQLLESIRDEIDILIESLGEM